MKKWHIMTGAVTFGVCGSILVQNSIEVKAEENIILQDSIEENTIEHREIMSEENINGDQTLSKQGEMTTEAALHSEVRKEEDTEMMTDNPSNQLSEESINREQDRISETVAEDEVSSDPKMSPDVKTTEQQSEEQVAVSEEKTISTFEPRAAVLQENPSSSKNINTWIYYEEEDTWGYHDNVGDIVSMLTPQGYWINGIQQYDSIISVNAGQYYYFEDRDKKGVRSSNTWSYSTRTQTWHKTGADGVIEETFNKQGYWVKGVPKSDTVIEIPNVGEFFITQGGYLSTKGWEHSKRNQTWYHSIDTGKVTAHMNRDEYVVLGKNKADTVLFIENVGYFYVNQEGKMATDTWSYSKSEDKWHYSNNYGIILSTIAPKGYWIKGVQQFDTVVLVKSGQYFYFEGRDKGGIRAENTWSYSPKTQSWHKTGKDGVIEETFNKQGYWIKGVAQFDKVLEHEGIKYFFERKVDGGKMSLNKWSKSDRDNVWYQSNDKGKLIKKDKVGPVLPRMVKLDNGQWRMFTLAQDNWHTGCWLRTAAAGINSAGGNMTPQQLIKDIKRTDDPRTGMLSAPWIVNNWSLGGVYSAVWPEALTPVVKKYVPNATNMNGASFNEIKRELANGNTVQVYFSWATPNIRLNGANGNGSFMGSRDYHSVLLTGYNDTGFYYQEHWGTPRNNHFSYSKLQWQYNSFGRKAISYRKAPYLP